MKVTFHSLDSNDNKVFFRSTCVKNGNEYRFKDKSAANTEISLSIRGNEVLFSRRGEIEMDLLINPTEKTEGHYKNSMGLLLNFMVTTSLLKIEENRIEMEYSLFFDEEMLSTHKIWVLFR